MLDEELWVYMDLNIKAYDPWSLIFLSKLSAAKNPVFSYGKDSLHDTGRSRISAQNMVI
jgi:hypothetical protein